MSQFSTHNKAFKFKGIDSEKWQLYIVTTRKIDDERPFGIISKLDMDENYSRPLFNKKTKERPSFNIELTRLDEDNNPLGMNDAYLTKIFKWLNSSKPDILEVGGFIYYGCFTKCNRWDNSAYKGILNYTFEMSDYYCYSHVMRNSYNLSDKDYMHVRLINDSNVDENEIPIDIKFRATDNTNLIIRNLSNNKKFIQSNILSGEEIQIYGESHEIFCMNNLTKNVFKNKSGDWINLIYGQNNLKVEGNGIITFTYQIPYGLR